MRAFIQEKYGTSSDIQLKEIATPQPKENEVLIKIYATTINDYDWSIMRGKPYLYRLIFGLFKPKTKIAGMELAGVVEAVGNNVSLLKVGDKVYGDTSDFGFGTFAEYICINEKAVVLKPHSMSFEQAAALPHASILAAQSLLDKGKIKKGQRILINGAGGGVGTLALQIAKLYDTEVTGVDTGDKLATMKSLGYDYVLDYKKVDFTKSDEEYDLIIDPKTNRNPFRYARVLKKQGKYITVGGTPLRLIQILFLSPLIRLLLKRKVSILALKPNKGLDYINQLFEEGKLKPIIDGPHEFEKIPQLIDYFGAGLHTGKIVITVSK